MGIEADAFTIPKIDQAKDSVRKVQAVLTEAHKNGEDVDPDMITGMFTAETIIQEYKKLFEIP